MYTVYSARGILYIVLQAHPRHHKVPSVCLIPSLCSIGLEAVVGDANQEWPVNQSSVQVVNDHFTINYIASSIHTIVYVSSSIRIIVYVSSSIRIIVCLTAAGDYNLVIGRYPLVCALLLSTDFLNTVLNQRHISSNQ